MKYFLFFTRVAMKSPQTGVIVTESSIFIVVFGDFDCTFNLRRSFVVTGGLFNRKKLQKTPSAKGIPAELLVRFLWANKENEPGHHE